LDYLVNENAEVDIHLADQLLLYAALAEGKTEYSISESTGHLKTNARIISKFIPERKITVSDSQVTIE